MQLALLISLVSIVFSLPVVVISYYLLIQFLSALKYPRGLGTNDVSLIRHPLITILIATFNERFVIGNTIDAIKSIDYPRHKIQVIVADDSDDITCDIIDERIGQLRSLGIESIVSRRKNRQNFKAGALNHACRHIRGEYVLLLDADSTVPSDVLSRGVTVLEHDPLISFVSFRVGHYNRDQNLTTRLFALSLDTGDAYGKMGAYRLDLPFSFQGGFTLISKEALEAVGYWSNGTTVEDADLSVKLYASGRKGVYLSDVRIFSEDPSSLGVWKNQAARVSQGWAACLRNHFNEIMTTCELSPAKKLGLMLVLLSPFASLSWLVVNFLSAFSISASVGTPDSSVFSSPIYIIVIVAPGLAMFGSAAYALHVQKLATIRNLILIPLLSYAGLAVFTRNSIGFLKGILGNSGVFTRTPKSGSALKEGAYRSSVAFDLSTIIEAVLSVTALALCIKVFQQGVWFLGFSLLAFGALTLKSMGLSELFARRNAPRRYRSVSEIAAQPSLTIPPMARQNSQDSMPKFDDSETQTLM